MDSKIIFLDVDGTLVDYEGRLPESAVRAVQQARARVYICTGRSRAEVYPELWAIGPDGMIGGNGSYVEDCGEVIMHQTLTGEQCRSVVDWLQERGLEFYLECNSGLYASADFETGAAAAVREYSRRKSGEAGVMTVQEAFPDMIYGGNLYREDVNKISFVLRVYQDYLDAAAAFPGLKAGTWGGSGETALFGDLGVKDHKGTRDRRAAGASWGRPRGHHRLRGCQGGYPDAGILRLRRCNGQRRPGNPRNGRPCDR